MVIECAFWFRLIVSTTTLLAVVAAASGEGKRSVDMTTVHPKPIDTILANPDMGWETFHTPANRDRSLPAWIPSTVYYLRWSWRGVEPEPGKLNTTLIDSELADAHKAGQKLAFRIMCCSSTPSEPYHPEWLKDVGGKIVATKYDSVDLMVPDLDDPVTLERHLSLIKRIAARYDGNPDLSHVDLGSVGWWGEWHMSGGGPVPMPKPETCRKIVDTYLQSFHKTPLLMLIGGGQQTGYACSHGTGWRADCLGDMGGFSSNWCHMRKGYPQWFKEDHLEDAWKHGPVAYESCWDMRKWVQEKWPLRYIFNYALATHATFLNNKSAPLPDAPDVKPELERFLKRFGYRFVLDEVSHSAVAVSGTRLVVSSRWQNNGSAPCYKPYLIAWRLKSNTDSRVFVSNTKVNEWMPGSVDVFTKEFLESPPDLPDGPVNAVQTELALPADLTPGDYEFAVAVVDPGTKLPVLQIAMEGRAGDGWYPVSRVRIAGKPGNGE